MKQSLTCDKPDDEPPAQPDVVGLIRQYYPPATLAHEVLVRHSEAVAEAALRIAEKVAYLNPDTRFIEQAALLHDIGIFYTRSPSIGCYGEYPYICHGYLGRRLLEAQGLFDHARVCESHVGVGLTAREIVRQLLPVPARDMVPVSMEEQIICFADLFFSKTPPPAGTRHSAASITASLARFGQDKVDVFVRWLELFGEPAISERSPDEPLPS